MKDDPLNVSPGATDGEPDRPSAPAPSRWSRVSPGARWGTAIGVAVILALILFILLFQWNWLRGPLAREMSTRLHRPVAITGNLEVYPWSWSPTVTINGLVIGNATWAGGGPLARVPRLTTRVKLLPLLGGKLIMPLMAADRPDILLVRDPSGQVNWNFTPPGAAPGAPLTIDHLTVSGGTVRYRDNRRRISFDAALSSDERASGAARGGSTAVGTLVIGNPAWAGAGPMARVPRLVVGFALLELVRNRLGISLVELDHADVRLRRDASGRTNWTLDNEKPKPWKLPPIAHLVIVDGALGYDDAIRQLHFSGVASSNEQATGSGRGSFVLNGGGMINGEPFTAQMNGEPLLGLDSVRPYGFSANIGAGATRLRLLGKFAHPFDFGVMSGTFGVSGPDFAKLYYLSGLALPSTPPYDLAGGFARSQEVYAFRPIHGRVGESDLSGVVTIDNTSGRPFMKADLNSRRLRLADLAAAVGGVPKNASAHVISPAQKVMAAKLKAEHRLLPDNPLAVDRLRGMDAKLVYRAQSVDAGKMPMRGLLLDLSLDHGVLTANPLDFILPQGRMTGVIRLDARPATPVMSMDMRLTNGRLENLIGKGGANPPLEGSVSGGINLAGAGNSVRAAAAAANGAVSVAVPSGEIRQAFAELLGIDASKGLLLLLGKSQGETPIRCAVFDFKAHNGVLTAQRIVLDTGVVLMLGTGSIDLRNETVDLRFNGRPKKFRLVRVNAPITVRGSLVSPKFGVDIGKAVPQALLSVAAGVALGPLAAIIPFLTPGLAKDANCSALLAASAAGGRR